MKTKTEYERISSRTNLSKKLLRLGYIFLGCLVVHLVFFWDDTRGVDPSWLKGSFIALMALAGLAFVLAIIIYPKMPNSYKKKTKGRGKIITTKIALIVISLSSCLTGCSMWDNKPSTKFEGFLTILGIFLIFASIGIFARVSEATTQQGRL
jgi:hypothetical protein